MREADQMEIAQKAWEECNKKMHENELDKIRDKLLRRERKEGEKMIKSAQKEAENKSGECGFKIVKNDLITLNNPKE